MNGNCIELLQDFCFLLWNLQDKTGDILLFLLSRNVMLRLGWQLMIISIIYESANYFLNLLSQLFGL